MPHNKRNREKLGLEWLVGALNSNAINLEPTFVLTEDFPLGIKCPTHRMLEVANELKQHGWSHKISELRLRKSTTRAVGKDVTDRVRMQLQETIDTAISQIYADQSNEMLQLLENDSVIAAMCISLLREDEKMPLRIVRSGSSVFIELITGF